MPRRRTSDNNLPWWVQAIYKVGIPSAIACYLVYVLVSNVNNTLVETRNMMAVHVADTATITKQNSTIQRILQSICMNTAKDLQQQQNCF